MKIKNDVYLLMYDITHDKTLQKVARLLEQSGYERLNYSVWYGNVNPVKNLEVSQKLKALLSNDAAKGSRVFYLPLGIKTFEKMRHFNGKPIEQMEYWAGKLKTAFF